MPTLLLAHILVWTWVGVAARSNLDLPGDMVEAYVWGQAWQWGYFKHPPLSAWMAGAWFAVMPRTHLSFALLSSVNTAIGLAGFVCLAREFLDRRWLVVALAAAVLTPGVTTLAMRFNCNAVLVATWPWALAFFVRYMRRAQLGDALAMGIAFALAMLAKYFSIVLLASLLITAIVHAPWRRRVWHRHTLFGLLAMALLLMPHLLWLLHSGGGPVQYAQHATGAADGPRRAAGFVLSQLVAPALGFALVWLAAQRHQRREVFSAVAELVWPGRRGWREPLWMLAALPIVLTALGTALLSARTAWVWGLPMALGVLLYVCRAAAERGVHPDLNSVRRFVLVAWALIAAIAPLSWHLGATAQRAEMAEPRAELAEALERLWSAEHGAALAWVSGSPALAASVAFYAKRPVQYWSAVDLHHRTPWIDEDRLSSEGGAFVCEAQDTACRKLGWLLGGSATQLMVAKHERGHDFAPRSYFVYWMQPVINRSPLE